MEREEAEVDEDDLVHVPGSLGQWPRGPNPTRGPGAGEGHVKPVDMALGGTLGMFEKADDAAGNVPATAAQT